MEQASMTSAYMWSFVVMAAFFLLAVLIANMILLNLVIQVLLNEESGFGFWL